MTSLEAFRKMIDELRPLAEGSEPGPNDRSFKRFLHGAWVHGNLRTVAAEAEMALKAGLVSPGGIVAALDEIAGMEAEGQTQLVKATE